VRNVALALAFLLAHGVAFAQPPSPAASPSAQPAVEDPAVTRIAKQQFEAWKAGAPDPALYMAGVDQYFTSSIKARVKTFLTSIGDVQSFKYVGKQLTAIGVSVDTYEITGSTGTAVETIHLDPKGKIDFLYFSPAQK
jgi:hypothetical protein